MYCTFGSPPSFEVSGLLQGDPVIQWRRPFSAQCAAASAGFPSFSAPVGLQEFVSPSPWISREAC